MIVADNKIMASAERVLAAIEADADGELCEIDEVMVIVTVHYGETDDGDAEIGSLFYRCSSGRQHVQLGLLAQAERAVDQTVRRENGG